MRKKGESEREIRAAGTRGEEHKVDVKSASAGKPSGMLLVRNDNGGNGFHMVGRRERDERKRGGGGGKKQKKKR